MSYADYIRLRLKTLLEWFCVPANITKREYIETLGRISELLASTFSLTEDEIYEILQERLPIDGCKYEILKIKTDTLLDYFGQRDAKVTKEEIEQIAVYLCKIGRFTNQSDALQYVKWQLQDKSLAQSKNDC